MKNKLKNRKTLTNKKLSRNFKISNLSNLQNRLQRHSFKRKKAAHGIRENIKTMALDTQANLAESGKGSLLCSQRKWSKFYYGEFIIKSSQFVEKKCIQGI